MKERIRRKWQDLDEALAEIEHLLTSNPERALRKDGEAWSAVEVLCHLYLTEYYALRYLKYKEQQTGTLPKTGWSHGIMAWLLKRYMRSNVKRQAPVIVDPRKLDEEDKYIRVEDLISDYKAVRSEFRAILDSKNESWYRRAIFKHPVAGRINALETLDFFYEHFQRHASQIRRAIGSVGQ